MTFNSIFWRWQSSIIRDRSWVNSWHSKA